MTSLAASPATNTPPKSPLPTSIPSSSTTSVHAVQKSPAVLTEGRKAELLQSARRSRLQWVLDGRDRNPVPAFFESPNSAVVASSAAAAADEAERRRQSVQQIIAQIPAAQCIEEVLNFFNELISDGEQVDLESILLTIQEEDDVDLLLEHFKQSQLTSLDDPTALPTAFPSNTGGHVSQYDVFIKKLLHPQAGLVVKAMQQFITKFTTSMRRNHKYQQQQQQQSNSSLVAANVTAVSTSSQSEEEAKRLSQAIWAFLEHIFEIMRDCPLFSSENPAQFEESKLCAEKFVFNKVHSFLFTANDFNDRVQNEATHQRIESLSFITVEHLDIKSLHSVSAGASVVSGDVVEQLLSRPITYLLHLQHVTCPHDALLILRYCSQAIAQILKESRTDGKLPGADELLPVMILAIKYANPPHIHSWIKYLQRFTRPSRLVSEAGYLITNFVSAVYFLDHVDANALTISPEEFEQAMKASKLRAKDRLTKQLQQQQQQQQQQTTATTSLEGSDIASISVEALVKEYNEEVSKRAQKEYISIKATMSLLTYGKP